jgi:hypothetical protein
MRSDSNMMEGLSSPCMAQTTIILACLPAFIMHLSEAYPAMEKPT